MRVILAKTKAEKLASRVTSIDGFEPLFDKEESPVHLCMVSIEQVENYIKMYRAIGEPRQLTAPLLKQDVMPSKKYLKLMKRQGKLKKKTKKGEAFSDKFCMVDHGRFFYHKNDYSSR